MDSLLPIYFFVAFTIAHSQEARKFIEEHRDLFDRILVGQAIIEELTLISKDEKIGALLGVNVLW